MRELVLQQLRSCDFANLNIYDAESHTYQIPRYSKPHYEIGETYVVKLRPAVVNNTQSVTAANWNGGTAPTSNYLKVYVSKTLGRMIYVDSIGFDWETKQDMANFWSGWLPIDDITLCGTFK